MRKIFILLFFLISASSFSQDVKDIWKQLGSDIDGEAADDRSGKSVSLSDDGTILAIGAFSNDGNGTNAGHVRVHKWNGTAWTEIADLASPARKNSGGGTATLAITVGDESPNNGVVEEWDGAPAVVKTVTVS